MAKLIVGVYLEDRECGGPEEGGWWYDRGELVRAMRVFGSEVRAYDYCLRLNARLDATLNRGRRPTSSVLSTGRYVACVFDDFAPRSYPEERPYYE